MSAFLNGVNISTKSVLLNIEYKYQPEDGERKKLFELQALNS